MKILPAVIVSTLLLAMIAAGCSSPDDPAVAEIPSPPEEPAPLRAADGIDVAAAEAYGIHQAVVARWDDILLLGKEGDIAPESDQLCGLSFDYLAEMVPSPVGGEQTAFIVQNTAGDPTYSITGYVNTSDRRVRFLRLLRGSAHMLVWNRAGTKIAYVVSEDVGLPLSGLYADDVIRGVSSADLSGSPGDHLQASQGRAEMLTWDGEDVVVVQLQPDAEGQQPHFAQLQLNSGDNPILILREGVHGPSRVFDLSDDRLIFSSEEITAGLTERWDVLTEGKDTAPLGMQMQPASFQTVHKAHYLPESDRLAVFLRGPYLAAVDFSGLAVYDYLEDRLTAHAVMLHGLPDGAPLMCPQHRRLAYTLSGAAGPSNNLIVADTAGTTLEVFSEFSGVFDQYDIAHREGLEFTLLRWGENGDLTFNVEFKDSCFEAVLNPQRHTLYITPRSE